jgi:hypothetical protein
MSLSHLSFQIWLIMSNFSFIPIVFHRFLTWIASINVDLFFRLILVTKASAVVEGTISATCLYYQCNQSIHVTDGITVTSLSAILQHKKSVARGLLSQIVLQQSHVKRNHVRKDLPVLRKTQVVLNVSAVHCYTCSNK